MVPRGISRAIGTYPRRRILSAEMLLRIAESADLAEELVRLDEESRAEKEREEVGPVRVVLRRRDHVLNEGVHRSGDEVSVSVDQSLEKERERALDCASAGQRRINSCK